MATQTIDEFAASIERAPVTAHANQGLRNCIPIIREKIASNFDSAATAAGSAWPPHAASTVKRYGPHPLLNLTGKMKAATLDPGANHIEIVSDGHLSFGVSGDQPSHPWTHQEGSEKAHVPQREFVAIDEDTVDKCLNEIADQVVSAFRG
jgi:phage gpG-like protein